MMKIFEVRVEPSTLSLETQVWDLSIPISYKEDNFTSYKRINNFKDLQNEINNTPSILWTSFYFVEEKLFIQFYKKLSKIIKKHNINSYD